MYAVHDSKVVPNQVESEPCYRRSLTILPRTRIREHSSNVTVLACTSGQARVEVMDYPTQHPGTGRRFVLYPGQVITVREKTFHLIGHELDECQVQCVVMNSH